ncbi:MAG: transposase [Clostridiales bacterium]|nr:transposase [Clostridiales bacterium]
MEQNIIEELTLMLLYLTSWKERGMEDAYPRSWKGYDFDILNRLSEKEMVVDGKRSKSVGITDDGVAKAKELLMKYGIEK